MADTFLAVDISNIDRLGQRLTTLDRKMQHSVIRKGLRAAVNPMVRDARKLAPRNTGKGAKSIRGRVNIRKGNGIARITWDKKYFYLRFHETGTRKMSARPFLRPAFDNNRANSLQRFIEAAREEIRKFDSPPEGGEDEFEVTA